MMIESEMFASQNLELLRLSRDSCSSIASQDSSNIQVNLNMQILEIEFMDEDIQKGQLDPRSFSVIFTPR
jgi:hypothetical protein